MTEIDFPEGFAVRGADAGRDAPAVFELIESIEEADIGLKLLDPGDIEASWRNPVIDLANDVILVHQRDQLLGYGRVYQWKAEVRVHPQARGQGLGTALLRWSEHRAIKRAETGTDVRLGQTIFDGDQGAVDFLTDQGYDALFQSWVLKLPGDVALPEPSLPAAVVVRPHRPGEERAVFQVIEDAFNEFPNRTPSTFEVFSAEVFDDPDFDPELVLVAVDGDQIIGAAVNIAYPDEGWLDKVAVVRSRRGEGFGQALIAASAAALAMKGRGNFALNTDSRTGALNVYLRLGMEVDLSFTHYSKVLRDG